jgi:hypothetical protein
MPFIAPNAQPMQITLGWLIALVVLIIVIIVLVVGHALTPHLVYGLIGALAVARLL